MNSHLKVFFFLLVSAALFASASAAPVVTGTGTGIGAQTKLLSPHRANPSAPYTFSYVERQTAAAANSTTSTTTGNPITDTINSGVNTANSGIDTVQKYTGLSRGAIIGIAIGVVALAVIILFACCCCCCSMCRK